MWRLKYMGLEKSRVTLVALLMLSSAVIYFFVSYNEYAYATSGNLSETIQTIFFATAGIVYLPLGIWMLKNKLQSKIPYLVSIIVSVLMILLYIVSRNIDLPYVGIQTDVGPIDIASKVIQGGIIVISAILLLKMSNHKLEKDQFRSHAI